MARRTSPPFRADHVGSLLRPPALHQARTLRAAGAITAAQLRQALTFASVPVHGAGQGVSYEAHGLEVTGKVRLAEPIFADHFAFLASAVTTAVPKLTIPSPSMAHFRADISASGYADRDEFRADLAAAYADEIAALAGLGCRYLQLDDTLFAFLNDPAWRAMAAGLGVDQERQHEVNLAVVNQALAGRPDGLTVTVHMCRGNYRSAWFSSGGYDFVAEAVFSGLQADGYFLCLSPQCGFASTVEGNALTPDQQRAKLDLVVRTAAQIWG